MPFISRHTISVYILHMIDLLIRQPVRCKINICLAWHTYICFSTQYVKLSTYSHTNKKGDGLNGLP